MTFTTEILTAEFDEPIDCHWFAGCFNPATKVATHPILDYVPICDRCAERLETS